MCYVLVLHNGPIEAAGFDKVWMTDCGFDRGCQC